MHELEVWRVDGMNEVWRQFWTKKREAEARKVWGNNAKDIKRVLFLLATDSHAKQLMRSYIWKDERGRAYLLGGQPGQGTIC